MRPRRSLTASAIGLLVLSACGCARSGTWNDDPQNWSRAMGSEPPPHVAIVHSRYWRSPHFTYECAYFFELENNDDLRRELFARNRLRPVSPADAKSHGFGEIPSWFCPKRDDRYDAWTYEDPPGSNFRLLIDKEDGHIFLVDYQI